MLWSLLPLYRFKVVRIQRCVWEENTLSVWTMERSAGETFRAGQAALGLESHLLRKYCVQIAGHRYLILKASYLLLLFGS